MVLYELQSSQIFLANYEFESSGSLNESVPPSQEQKIKLLCSLMDASANLMESWKCLNIEPPNSPVGQRIKLIKGELADLEEYINMVKNI